MFGVLNLLEPILGRIDWTQCQKRSQTRLMPVMYAMAWMTPERRCSRSTERCSRKIGMLCGRQHNQRNWSSCFFCYKTSAARRFRGGPLRFWDGMMARNGSLQICIFNPKNAMTQECLLVILNLIETDFISGISAILSSPLVSHSTQVRLDRRSGASSLWSRCRSVINPHGMCCDYADVTTPKFFDSKTNNWLMVAQPSGKITGM